MSIDTILNRILTAKEDDFVLSESNLDEYIKTNFLHSPGSKRLCIFLPPWRTDIKYSATVGKKITAAGYSFLGYVFPVGILSSDVEATKKYFDRIKIRVVRDVQNLQKQFGFTTLRMIGVSLGCVNASMIANEYRKFEKIILVVPGHCLAESLWYGLRTQHLRKQFEEKSITLEQLKKAWRDLAPENNLAGMKNSSVILFLSKSDKIIPYRFGEKLAEVMKNNGINLMVKKNKFLGHYGTAFVFYKIVRLAQLE